MLRRRRRPRERPAWELREAWKEEVSYWEGSRGVLFDAGWGVSPPVLYVPHPDVWDAVVPPWLVGRFAQVHERLVSTRYDVQLDPAWSTRVLELGVGDRGRSGSAKLLGMSAIDHLVHANESYTQTFPGPRPVKPKLRLTVITCMDSRLDLFGALGLDIGDAHLLRNAGGIPTEDTLRSLAISQRALGTREVVIIHHTECGMNGFDDETFRAQLAEESGVAPGWDVPGFTDIDAQVRKSVETVRDCAWIQHRDDVRGFVFDVATAALREVR